MESSPINENLLKWMKNIKLDEFLAKKIKIGDDILPKFRILEFFFAI
jgi:hypothetical protein